MAGPLQTPFTVACDASMAVLAAASPQVSSGEAEALMLRHYAIAGSAARLRGERDDNFRIDGRDGERLVLKVAHHREDPLVTNLHTSLLLYLAIRAHAIPAPRVLPTRDGRSELQLTEGRHAGRIARVTSYLYGRPLQAVPTSASVRRDVGATLARLGRGLRDFTHGSADRVLLWDLQRAHNLRELVTVIPDRNDRQTLLRHIDRFADVVSPQLTGQGSQMIHNDFNGGNILIDPYRRTRLRCPRLRRCGSSTTNL